MPKQTPLVRSFNAGEWSPLMAGRVDLDKYSASCRKMLNFLPTPQGAALVRSGTAFVVTASSNDNTGALLPFQFSTLQSCVLEFGDKILRFVTIDGLVTSDGTNPYTVTTPYAAADTINLRYAQKNDVLYLFCEGYPVYKLERLADNNWTLQKVSFTDGPYLDTNYTQNLAQPQSIGGAAAENWTWTSNSSGTGTDVTYDQTGQATWNFASSVTLTGYQLILPQSASLTVDSTIYTAKDRAPSTWVLYGSNDQSTWTALDSQTTYVDYQSNASDWIPLYSGQAFQYYKLAVTQTYIQQDVSPILGTMLFTSDTDTPFGVKFSNTDNINFGAGFTQDDVGRDMRLQRSDGIWTAVQITSVFSSTSIACACLGAPLLDTTATTFWRLGLYCEANGYPSCGAFFAERLWLGGASEYPDTVCASQVGNYEDMQVDDPRTGDISDSDAINVTLESRSKVLWITSDDRGVVLGTSAGEWTIQAGGSSAAITPTSISAKNPTQRGSAAQDVVRIDHEILYVQRSGRETRALAYSFSIDGYTSTSLSVQASHLSQPKIVRMAYAAEPYSNVWAIRSDGVLLSLTYMQDEQVSGWAQHDIGGVVESLCCIPAPDLQQDALWMLVKREVNGQTVRFLERMLRTWDFDLTKMDAAFVDSCTVDTSLSQSTSAFSHLAGEDVYGLIDGVTPFGPLPVSAEGILSLPSVPETQVVAGLGYSAELVTQNIEAGMQLGTAQGKIKRVNQVIARLWATGSGNIGRYQSLNNPYPEITPIQFLADYNCDTSEAPLYSFDYPFQLQGGYDRTGALQFTKGPGDLFPFNIVSLTLSVEGEDGW